MKTEDYALLEEGDLLVRESPSTFFIVGALYRVTHPLRDGHTRIVIADGSDSEEEQITPDFEPERFSLHSKANEDQSFLNSLYGGGSI